MGKAWVGKRIISRYPSVNIHIHLRPQFSMGIDLCGNIFYSFFIM